MNGGLRKQGSFCLFVRRLVSGTSYLAEGLHNTDKKVGNIKVALLSDSHVGTTFHGEGFAERMKEIEKQNPDVILVAGILWTRILQRKI